MKQQFPNYPLDREVTHEEYAKGYKLEQEEYRKVNQEIESFLNRMNIELRYEKVDGRLCGVFYKPSVPADLDSYIFLQELMRSRTVTL